jgi:hypothetical protein
MQSPAGLGLAPGRSMRDAYGRPPPGRKYSARSSHTAEDRLVRTCKSFDIRVASVARRSASIRRW